MGLASREPYPISSQNIQFSRHFRPDPKFDALIIIDDWTVEFYVQFQPKKGSQTTPFSSCHINVALSRSARFFPKDEYFECYTTLAWLFKKWIRLHTGQISVDWKMLSFFKTLIHQIMIYPVNSRLSTLLTLNRDKIYRILFSPSPVRITCFVCYILQSISVTISDELIWLCTAVYGIQTSLLLSFPTFLIFLIFFVSKLKTSLSY